MRPNVLHYGDNLDERKEFDFPKGYSLKSGGAKPLKRTRDQATLGIEA